MKKLEQILGVISTSNLASALVLIITLIWVDDAYRLVIIMKLLGANIILFIASVLAWKTWCDDGE